MSRLILIALILLTVAGLHPAPVTATESQTIENCWHNGRLRPVPGRWYRVASRINDDWLGFGSMGVTVNQLEPEPGMPQALGFDTWQALSDDIASGTGQITDVGLRFARPGVGSEMSQTFMQFPAGLIPEGRPSSAESLYWYYFRWDFDDYFTHAVNIAMVRFQHEGGPIITFDAGRDFVWDVEFALYVKM
ncbi:MAG: hypothetical protein OXH72_12765 [Caldilineaceae bacterium]|nr:hypothetical protein [Caldilineaceae bacterium]